MTQDWLNQRERSNVVAIRVIAWIALALGRGVARVVLVPICAYFLLFGASTRAASRGYLRRVLGRRASLAEVFRHYYTFASVALDRVYLLKDRVAMFQLRPQHEEVLARYLARGESCLLLGAHLGSFEVLGAFGRAKGLRVALVMYEDNARKVQAVAKALNPQWGDSVIGLGRYDSMLRLEQRVAAGDWVGVLGDRALDDEGQIEVPFLGGTAAFPVAPFRVAAMLGKPIVLMLGLYRGGNRYDLHFEELVADPVLARDRREDRLQEWTALYARRLEHYCRLAPFNWFNFYDFWK